MTIEAGNAGAGAGNTVTGTAAQTAGNTESEVVKGLTRQINATKAELDEAKKGSAKAVELEAELANTKAELAKTKTLAKYGDIADILTDSFERGMNPDKVDDDFVAKIRTKFKETTDEGPRVNPVKGSTTPEQDAERLLRGLTSLI